MWYANICMSDVKVSGPSWRVVTEAGWSHGEPSEVLIHTRVPVFCLKRKRKPDRKPDCVGQETPESREPLMMGETVWALRLKLNHDERCSSTGKTRQMDHSLQQTTKRHHQSFPRNNNHTLIRTAVRQEPVSHRDAEVCWNPPVTNNTTRAKVCGRAIIHRSRGTFHNLVQCITKRTRTHSPAQQNKIKHL